MGHNAINAFELIIIDGAITIAINKETIGQNLDGLCLTGVTEVMFLIGQVVFPTTNLELETATPPWLKNTCSQFIAEQETDTGAQACCASQAAGSIGIYRQLALEG